jgi:hypothetical protein
MDNQSAIREEIKRVESKVENNGKRIDKLGLQISNLKDDTPIV